MPLILVRLPAGALHAIGEEASVGRRRGEGALRVGRGRAVIVTVLAIVATGVCIGAAAGDACGEGEEDCAKSRELLHDTEALTHTVCRRRRDWAEQWQSCFADVAAHGRVVFLFAIPWASSPPHDATCAEVDEYESFLSGASRTRTLDSRDSVQSGHRGVSPWSP
jgi:hypothetical protein